MKNINNLIKNKNLKFLAIPALAAAMVMAPLAPANASNYYWHGRGFSHGGPGIILGLLGAAVVGAAAVATFPIRAVADASAPEPPPPPQPYYAPQAAYYPQQPEVVYQQPVYYAPRPRVIYSGPAYYYR